MDSVAAAACTSARLAIPSDSEIANWHNSAFLLTVPKPYYAGNFRQYDDTRICLAQNVAVGDVPGSHFEVVPEHMRALCQKLHSDLIVLEQNWNALEPADRLRRLARCIGATIGAFIRIHPFLNGNGRTSRMLWCALLHRFGVPPQAAVTIRPMQPYGQVMAAAMRGNYGPVIAMVLTGLAHAAPPTN